MATIEELKAERESRKQTGGVTREQLLAERSRRQGDKAVEDIGQFAKDIASDVKGVGEAALTIGTAAFAEPVAGLLGIKELILQDAQEGAKTVKDIQEGLTFQPGESGQEKLIMLGEGIAKIGQMKGIDKIVENAETAFNFAVEKVGIFASLLANPLEFITTGGKPTSEKSVKARGVAESIATAFPFAALELTGVKGFKTLSKLDHAAVDAAKTTRTIPNQVKAVKEISGNAKKMLQEAAPSTEALKTGATAIYDQIDNLGVKIKPESLSKFADDSAELLRREGFDAQSHVAVNRALIRLQEAEGAINTTEIGVLRKVAQNASKSSDKSEARLGRLLVNRFDDFLTELTPAQATGPDVKGLGVLYKKAGELWRRSIKTDTLNDLFDNATDVSSKGELSFAKSLQNEFASLVRRNRKTKQFNENEVNQMRKVFSQGTTGGILNFVGQLDLSQGQKANMLAGLSGVGAGFAAGGPLGGIAVPGVGFLSRALADKLTLKKGEFAKAVVAAGANGDDIVKAYLKNVPKNKRDSIELTELLINSGADLKNIKSKAPLVRESIDNAQNFTPDELALIFGLATPSGIPEQEVQQ